MQGQFTRSWSGAEEAPPGSVRPRFHIEAVQDELASAREGRPIFREEERVEIFMPGNPYTIPVHRVTDVHRQRWPREYEQFRQGIEQTVEGTPLGEWPVINRAMALELNGLGIQTVEELAALSDLGCQRIMGGTLFRGKAQAYLDDAERIKLTEQLSAENEAQRSEMASQKRQIEELGVLVNRLHGELMSMRNAPSAIASTIPGQADPFQQLAMQQPGVESRAPATSSLGAFVEQEKKRVGWPKGKPRKPVISDDEAA